MRIVSTLPTGTEIVCALGLGDRLCGISHACHYPAWVRTLPRVTRVDFDYRNASSGEIDAHVEHEMCTHRSLYSLDEDLVRNIAPTHLLIQELCDVCAVTPSDISNLIKDMEQPPEVVSMNPKSLEGIMEEIMRSGAILGATEPAQVLVDTLRKKLENIRDRSAHARNRTVFCVEWLDPIFDSGHWVPEMVEAAGGKEVMGQAQRHSQKAKWEDVLARNPEIIVFMPCSFSPARTVKELPVVTSLPDWSDMRAVREKNVWIVDGRSYFNQSGPRVIEKGIEILGKILHPDIFSAPTEDEALNTADL